MRSSRRLPRKALFLCLAFGGMLLSLETRAAAPCTDLPLSALQIFDIKASHVEEVRVPTEELDRGVVAGGLASRHTMMLTVRDVIVWFDVMHRMVPREDGSVCDAPSLVRMGLGSGRRLAVLASAAAADTCVRGQMLAHEAAHTRAFDETVDRFIDNQRSNFQRAMSALKQTPAPNPEIATARWETGLKMLVTEAKRLLLADLQAANALTDGQPALAALENACGGKIRKLEARSG